MSDSQEPQRLDPELVSELRQTAETLGRLGQTLAGISYSFLSPRQRNTAERLAVELRRAGELIPRTVTLLLEDRSAPARPTRRREDLGSRLRRLERRDQQRSEVPVEAPVERAAPSEGAADEPEQQ